jgi:DNA polymerase/3'-5' exonuclease PolX
MKHADALVIAQRMVERLRPACLRLEIAGGVRRGKAEPHDIEIVAVPDPTVLPRPRLEFGKPPPVWHRTMIEKIVAEMADEGAAHVKENGPKYKKLWLINDGIQLDLFLVTPPADWGVQFVIRTGSADFSHWIVSHRRIGGAMPNGNRVQDGALWIGAEKVKNPDPLTKLSMPEEIDFLNFLSLGWIEPGEREARWKK